MFRITFLISERINQSLMQESIGPGAMVQIESE
jgi:hypothetical protein